MRLLASSGLLVLVLPGCGPEPAGPPPAGSDGGAGSDPFQSLIGTYNEGVETGDGALICQEVMGLDRRIEDCAQGIEEAMASEPSSYQPLELVEIRERGHTAQGLVREGGERYTVTFLRKDGRWTLMVFD